MTDNNEMPDEIFLTPDEAKDYDPCGLPVPDVAGMTRYTRSDLYPTAKVVDVDALRRYVPPSSDVSRGLYPMRQYDYDTGWNACIDHLVSTGIIASEGDKS